MKLLPLRSSSSKLRTRGRKGLEGLPPEVLVHIMSFLSPLDLCSIALVSTWLGQLSCIDSLWRPLCDPSWAKRNVPRRRRRRRDEDEAEAREQEQDERTEGDDEDDEEEEVDREEEEEEDMKVERSTEWWKAQYLQWVRNRLCFYARSVKGRAHCTERMKEVKMMTIPCEGEGQRTIKLLEGCMVILVGGPGVGTTKLHQRLFSPDPYGGASWGKVEVDFDDQKRVILKALDEGGSGEYERIAAFPSCRAVLMVYDVTDRLSMADFPIIKEIILNERRTNNKLFRPCIILVGNKIDREDERAISLEEAQEYSRWLGAHFVMEVSALTGEGERELMDLLIDLAVAPVDPYAAAFGSQTSRLCAVPTRQEVKRLKRQARKMAVCSLQ